MSVCMPTVFKKEDWSRKVLSRAISGIGNIFSALYNIVATSHLCH